MVHLDHVVAVLEESCLGRVERSRRGRLEGDVIHPRGQAQPGADRGIEVGKGLVVEIPYREQLAVAGVVEQMTGPAGLLEGGCGLGLHEREAHRLGVEAVGRVEVAGGDGDVVKRHGRHGTAGRTVRDVDRDETELGEADLHPDPFVQFGRWYDHAIAHGALQPDAMIVATSSLSGRPSVRMVLERLVLLRGAGPIGFGFFTNFESRKGVELSANPHAAIAFHWPAVLRQVRATGPVERIDDREADTYWASRPRASQLSAWASAQSAPIKQLAPSSKPACATSRRASAMASCRGRPSGAGSA